MSGSPSKIYRESESVVQPLLGNGHVVGCTQRPEPDNIFLMIVQETRGLETLDFPDYVTNPMNVRDSQISVDYGDELTTMTGGCPIITPRPTVLDGSSSDRSTGQDSSVPVSVAIAESSSIDEDSDTPTTSSTYTRSSNGDSFDRDVRGSQIPDRHLERLSGFSTHELKDELHFAARNNLPGRLEMVCQFIQSTDYKLTNKRMLGETYGETALDVATIRNNTKCACILATYGGPELILKAYSTEEYAGLTALHLAIMNNNTEIVDKILETLDSNEKRKLMCSKANGKHFKERYNFAWYPITLAAAVGSMKIFDSLVENGADPLMTDSDTGNTIYHSLARVSLAAPDLACHTLERILSSPSMAEWWKVQPDKPQCHCLAEALLKQVNNDGYTPLTYATCIGATKAATTILEIDQLYKFHQWKVGSDQLTFYELSEIDPVVASRNNRSRASVLEAYAFLFGEKNVEFGKVPVMQQMMENKWEVYHGWFYSWLFYHVFLMVIFSFCVVHRFMPWTFSHSVNSSESNAQEHDVFLGSINSGVDVFFLFLEIFILLSAFLYFISEVRDIISLLRKKYWVSSGFSRHIRVWLTIQFDVFRLILVLYSCSLFALTLLRVSGSPWQDVAYATTSLSGWLFLMFFTRASKNIGIFTIMMAEMVKNELSYFIVVITILICGCGVAMFCMFEHSPNDLAPEQVRTLHDTLFSLFRLMVGLEEMAIFEEARVPWIMRLLFVLFIVFAVILLLNMLIAAMNNTYNRLETHKELMWLQARTKATLLIERRLPSCFRPCHRLRQLDPERLDSWFLSSTEVTENHPLANLTEQSFISM